MPIWLIILLIFLGFIAGVGLIIGIIIAIAKWFSKQIMK